MSNFKIDSKSIRKQIINIIGEHYKENIEKDFGMIILKELIQNANDAKAESLSFGHHKGFSKSKNSLLRNSGLFFINDGEFVKSDLISINKMWDNAKGDNPNQIGKFGLGLKSVFHWCEAFFYFSSGISDSFKNEEARKRYNDKFEVFNPWEPTLEEIELSDSSENEIKPYPDWSKIFEEDYKKIVNDFDTILKNLDKWFIIWIPLRTKKLEKRPAFKNFYPGDDTNFINVFEDSNLLNEISSILPFMSKLKEISFWKSTQGLQKAYSIRNEYTFPRIEENDYKTLDPFETNIFLNENKYSKNVLSYKYEQSKNIEVLKNESGFPRNEEGKSEKAFNHGAFSISILQEKSNTGKIILDWCVFLPLSEKRFETNCEDFTIHIKLHGWFFIDSGRNSINFGNRENAITIKSKWNRLIAEQNTLPQVIPLINKLIKIKSDNKIIEIIIKHIRESEIYSTDWMKASLTKNFSVIKRFKHQLTDWFVIDSNIKFYSISNDYKLYEKSFLKFNQIIENNIFTNSPDQVLSIKKQNNWSDEFFDSFFEINFNEVLKNKQFRKFWISAIKNKAEFIDYSVREQINLNYLNTIKNFLLQIEWNRVGKSNNEISELLSLISDKIMTLSIETKSVFNTLNSIDLGLIFLPKKHYENSNNLNNKDSIAILKWICEKQITNRHKLSSEILDKSKYQQIKNEIVDLPIFELIDKDSNKLFASINEIENKIVVDANSSAELINCYADAFQNITIYKFVFYKELHELKRMFPKIKPLSLKVISDKIQNYNHNYDKYTNRKELINVFLQDYKSEYKEIIRQIFLGEHPNLSQELYVFKKDNFSYKITLEILKKNNLVHKVFLDSESKLFDEKIQKELNIFIITELPKEILKLPMKNVNLSFLKNSEKESIYKQIEDNPLFLNLPIYETVNNEIITLNNDVFMLAENMISSEIPINKQTVIPFNKFIQRSDKIKLINHIYLIELCLESGHPEKYFDEILNNMGYLSLKEIKEDSKIYDLLRKTAWISAKTNRFYSLDCILYHHNYSEDAKLVISKYYKTTGQTSGFVSYKSIIDKMLNHKHFGKIKELNLWLNEQTFWEKIGELISKIPSLNIGKLYSSPKLSHFKLILVKNSEIEIIKLITKWESNVKPKYLVDFIIPAVFNNNPSVEIQIKILNYIQKFCEKHIELTSLHEDLLIAFLDKNNNNDILKNIKLLNDNSEWKQANELCLPQNDIPKKYRLKHNYDKCLRNYKFLCKPNIIQKNYNKYNDEDLLEYFKKIANNNETINRKQIGIFLVFMSFIHLSHKNTMNEWAKKYFIDEYQIKSILKNIEISTNLHDPRFKFKLTEIPEEINKRTITGDLISVEPIPVLISERNYEVGEDNIVYINKVNPKSSVPFDDIFLNALSLILYKVYGVRKKDTNIVNIWKRYSKSNQFDIKYTRKMLFNDILSRLRVSGLAREDSDIKRVLDDYVQIEYNKTQSPQRNYNKDQLLLQEDLKDLLNCSEVKNGLLCYLKNHIEKIGYSKKSILFELFQNADDAYVEKKILGLENIKLSFEIIKNSSGLDIIHHGRNINQSKGNSDSEKETFGFNFDLLKMLSLNYSDKLSKGITGKFGLGFKSIFLICDKPKILSGELIFEIVAGMFPEKIEVSEFKEYLELKQNNPTTTVFRLQNLNISSSGLIQDFKIQAPLLPIFSKAIKEVKIGQNIYKVDKQKINDSLSVIFFDDFDLLLFEKNNWKMVFKYTENGFEHLDSFKKVWVTVPTDTDTNYRFVINANFNIDIGRQQLAVNNNTETFEEIASDFYQILENLYQSDNYPRDVKKNDFWSSLFTQLTESDIEDKLHSIFWDNDIRSYLNLTQKIDILPNGLDKEYYLQISLKIIKYVLADELNESKYLDLFVDLGFSFENCISNKIFNLLSKNIQAYSIQKIDLDNYWKHLQKEPSKKQEKSLRIMEIELKGNRISSDSQKRKDFKKDEKDKIEREEKEIEEENAKFINQKKYSFGWFKCIVDASCKQKEVDYSNQSETVTFSKCDVNESGDLIILQNPTRYLLQSYETSNNFRLFYGLNRTELENEIRGVTLIGNRVEILLAKKVKQEKTKELIRENLFRLKFEDYVDISQKLKTAFYKLHLSNKYCMKENLPHNINFVFGPPGTGKTYNIAEKIIRYQKNKKILVLAPTNKAANEIYLKVAEQTQEHTWMIRFGNCSSPAIIEDERFFNSSANFNNDIRTIITTAIRFPYDGFRNLNFAETKWDYVICDEASMIPIQLIAFIIHKVNRINPNCNLIIAGDPKQIPPIYSFTDKKMDRETYKEYKGMEDYLKGDKAFNGIDIKSGENIYSMVKLNDFIEAKQITEPHQFFIENLYHQYRSIPIIGDIYSNYAYNGLLTHERKNTDFEKLNIPDIEFSNINIIQFPLLGGEIYHSRYVNLSHAHPYSALLINEFLNKLDRVITKKLEIGIISPYKPQVKMVEKLIGKSKFVNLNIQVDTVHGFQGGQKQIIFCIFNPPVNYKDGKEPNISCGERALINKEYIVNVAISRARDYLFILAPTDKYEVNRINKSLRGFDKLKEIQNISSIIQKFYSDCKQFDSSEIEKWCFNRKDYIYQNSNVISHDLINVYQQSPKKYLVSHDEHSIDVQIKVDK